MPNTILHAIGQLVRGGAERQLLLVASALAARGWSQSVVTFQPGSAWDHELEARGVRLFPVKQSRLKLGRLLEFCRIVAAQRPDIVHSWSHHTTVYSSWARKITKFRFVASLRHNPTVDSETGHWFGGLPHSRAYAD